jgi:hypothetical protein
MGTKPDARSVSGRTASICRTPLLDAPGFQIRETFLAQTRLASSQFQRAKLFLIMVTAIVGGLCAICILAGIGILRIAKVRRARSIDREMRNYVRRAY